MLLKPEKPKARPRPRPSAHGQTTAAIFLRRFFGLLVLGALSRSPNALKKSSTRYLLQRRSFLRKALYAGVSSLNRRPESESESSAGRPVGFTRGTVSAHGFSGRAFSISEYAIRSRSGTCIC